MIPREKPDCLRVAISKWDSGVRRKDQSGGGRREKGQLTAAVLARTARYWVPVPRLSVQSRYHWRGVSAPMKGRGGGTPEQTWGFAGAGVEPERVTGVAGLMPEEGKGGEPPSKHEGLRIGNRRLRRKRERGRRREEERAAYCCGPNQDGETVECQCRA